MQACPKRVDPNLTSQTCPRCQTITGNRKLSERIHSCPDCGYIADRDVSAAQVVVYRDSFEGLVRIILDFGFWILDLDYRRCYADGFWRLLNYPG